MISVNIPSPGRAAFLGNNSQLTSHYNVPPTQIEKLKVHLAVRYPSPVIGVAAVVNVILLSLKMSAYHKNKMALSAETF